MTKTTLLLTLALVVISATLVNGRFVGGRIQIENVKSNQEVQELGRFSVDDYNRSDRLRWPGVNGVETPLRFVKVVEAERQVVAGIKYFLKVEAVQGDEKRVFDAEVVVKPWLSSKKLLNFGPSNENK